MFGCDDSGEFAGSAYKNGTCFSNSDEIYRLKKSFSFYFFYIGLCAYKINF